MSIPSESVFIVNCDSRMRQGVHELIASGGLKAAALRRAAEYRGSLVGNEP
jgi:FixJ family two-component response regulator